MLGTQDDEPCRAPVGRFVVFEQRGLHRQGVEPGIGSRDHPPQAGAGPCRERRFECVAARHDAIRRDVEAPPGVAACGAPGGPARPVGEDHHRPARRAERPDRVRDPRYRLRPDVDHPVAVEDECVVALGEGDETGRRLRLALADRSGKAGLREATKDGLRVERLGLRNRRGIHRQCIRRPGTARPPASAVRSWSRVFTMSGPFSSGGSLPERGLYPGVPEPVRNQSVPDERQGISAPWMASRQGLDVAS